VARTSKNTQRRKPGAKARPPHPGEAERIADRRAKVWALRLKRQSYAAIAAQVGCDKSTVCRDLAADRAELVALRKEAAEDEREMALELLDRLWAALETKGLKRGDHRAVTAAVRIIERRSRLLGLDAPVKLANPNGTGLFELVRLVMPDNGRPRSGNAGGGQ